MRNETEIRQSLETARKEWLQQPDREGAFYNFRRFLLDYCPEELRTPPIENSKGQRMSFDEALGQIYGRFRSPFLHEGFADASQIVASRWIHVEACQLTIVKGVLYFIDLTKIVPWFSKIVNESLYSYLMGIKKQQ
jgi:hypothetical protein